MVSTTNGQPEFESSDNLEQNSDVQAVIDKIGPSDLAKVAADLDAERQAASDLPGSSGAQWVYGASTDKTSAEDPAAVALASPVTYVDPTDPAALLFHGSNDALVSPSQTLIVSDALQAAGVSSTRYVLDGAGHGDLACSPAVTRPPPRCGARPPSWTSWSGSSPSTWAGSPNPRPLRPTRVASLDDPGLR